MIKWIEKTLQEKQHTFYKIIMTIKQHFDRILNFFDNRSTNPLPSRLMPKLSSLGLTLEE